MTDRQIAICGLLDIGIGEDFDCDDEIMLALRVLGIDQAEIEEAISVRNDECLKRCEAWKAWREYKGDPPSNSRELWQLKDDYPVVKKEKSNAVQHDC